MDFHSEIHRLLQENEINPSIELTNRIAEMEDEAYLKFPEYMIQADEVENAETRELWRDTTNRYVWRDSVRAVGSFGFATVWWTEPYVGADFYRYKINRRHQNSAYYYNRVISYNPQFDYWRDKSVYGNTYYYYYARLERDGRYYLSTNAIRTYIPEL